jgi:hypothetical protein
MIDAAITWAMHNPLQSVAVLAGVSIAIGLILVPSMHEVAGHGPPKC